MLQVYDRVLPSRSVPTLIALIILAITLYVAQGAIVLVRSRISVRVGRHLDQTLSLRVFDALARLPLKTRGDGDGLQPLRAVFSQATVRPRFSTFRGCRFISASASCFISGSARRSCRAAEDAVYGQARHSARGL
jgi:hypothetical protein